MSFVSRAPLPSYFRRITTMLEAVTTTDNNRRSRKEPLPQQAPRTLCCRRLCTRTFLPPPPSLFEGRTGTIEEGPSRQTLEEKVVATIDTTHALLPPPTHKDDLVVIHTCCLKGEPWHLGKRLSWQRTLMEGTVATTNTVHTSPPLKRANETGVNFYFIVILYSKSNLLLLPCILTNERIRGGM